ncbi:methyltransferase domain-containing protein [archaeon]|nr:methyltransferase domain-containing protein [archaeon]MBL7057510.1 methyltransferase domain-containing protein [Candidatus Woesearchaeota archaeon]
MYLYLLSKANLKLSIAEVMALSKNKEFEVIENGLLLNELVDYTKLAYTKKVFRVLFVSNEKKLLEDMKKFNFNDFYNEDFKLELVNSKNHDLKTLADIIWGKLENPKVNLKEPKTFFEILFFKKTFCCLKLWENNDKFEERKAHLRPYNHPTSLDPRLARCLVNLVDSKEVMDPFCGSGGLLIEAALIGCKITGYDIDQIMLKRCDQNLKHYKIKNFTLEKRDALKLNKKTESIVTDLPYGKNSKVNDLEQTFVCFLKNSYGFTNKLVIVFPDFVESKHIIKKSGWKIKLELKYYIHKSLTKEIFLLFKDT